MKKIYIDPGHGTYGSPADMGAAKYGRNEADDVMGLCYLLERFLRDCGFETRLSRDGMTNKGISARTSEANSWGADFFLSVHRNAGGGTGHENWILSSLQGKSSNNEKQAKILVDAVCAVDGLYNRGVKFGTPNPKIKDFGVNSQTNMNSCLLEIGFIDSQKDNSAFDNYATQYAVAITKALCGIFGIAFKDPFSTSTPESKASSMDSGYTANDARMALRISARLEPVTWKDLRMYDMDGDGQISAADARTILRISAKVEAFAL
jgi:N-acetylmuramoyl-L-alanine amidase